MFGPWQKHTLRPWAGLALAVALSGFLLSCATSAPIPTPTPTPEPTPTPNTTAEAIKPTREENLNTIQSIIQDLEQLDFSSEKDSANFAVGKAAKKEISNIIIKAQKAYQEGRIQDWQKALDERVYFYYMERTRRTYPSIRKR